MSQDLKIHDLAKQIIAKASAAGLTICTAESCTGGLIAAALTDIPGASNVIDRGFITYSNEAKAEVLGVPEVLIKTHGAVSNDVAAAMATGALERAKTDISLSVTGIAGPGGGTAEKPVGLVWFGLALKGGESQTAHYLFGNHSRETIRQKSVYTALSLILEKI